MTSTKRQRQRERRWGNVLAGRLTPWQRAKARARGRAKVLRELREQDSIAASERAAEERRTRLSKSRGVDRRPFPELVKPEPVVLHEALVGSHEVSPGRVIHANRAERRAAGWRGATGRRSSSGGYRAER